MVQYSPVWSRMVPYGPIWSTMVLYGTLCLMVPHLPLYLREGGTEILIQSLKSIQAEPFNPTMDNLIMRPYTTPPIIPMNIPRTFEPVHI